MVAVVFEPGSWSGDGEDAGQGAWGLTRLQGRGRGRGEDDMRMTMMGSEEIEKGYGAQRRAHSPPRSARESRGGRTPPFPLPHPPFSHPRLRLRGNPPPHPWNVCACVRGGQRRGRTKSQTERVRERVCGRLLLQPTIWRAAVRRSRALTVVAAGFLPGMGDRAARRKQRQLAEGRRKRVLGGRAENNKDCC